MGPSHETTLRLTGPDPRGTIPGSMAYERDNIRQLEAYVPGEQPQPGDGVIKLNTNENPYPPA